MLFNETIFYDKNQYSWRSVGRFSSSWNIDSTWLFQNKAAIVPRFTYIFEIQNAISFVEFCMLFNQFFGR